MKRIVFTILLMGVLLIGITGCGEKKVNEYSFLGKVVEVGNSHIIVEPNEDEEESQSCGKFHIKLKEDNITYKVGTEVKIFYTGIIEETNPARIDATKVEILSLNSFKLIFHQMPGNIKKQIIDEKDKTQYDYNVYIYNGDIEIVIDNKTYSLETALKNNVITMEEIIEKANQDIEEPWIYLDGGSKEYHYEDYTIIKLHTLDGNRDVYFGNKDLNINDFAH